jgi:hypothetical protein
MNVFDINFYNKELITINDPINIDNEDNYYCSLNYDNGLFNVKTNHSCYSYRPIDTIDNKNYLLISLGKDYALFFQELYNILLQLIFVKSEDWFEESLTLTEIENSFIFPLKSNIEKGTYDIKAYLDKNTFYIKDHLNNIVNIENLLDKEIIPNLYIKGVLFNSKTFMLDVEVKDIFIINTESIKENNKIEENNETCENVLEENENKDDLEENKEDLEKYNDELEDLEEYNDELENKDDLEEYNINKELLDKEDININSDLYNDVCILIENKIQNEIKTYIQKILDNKKVNIKVDLEKELFGGDEISLLDSEEENV